jgi:hypothetical protein
VDVVVDPVERSEGRFWRGFLFVASAAIAAAALHFSWVHPLFGIALAGFLTVFLVWRWWSHHRLVRDLERGDASSALSRWATSLESLPHAETMAPLMTATALAAFGRLREARETLAAAARGPVWEAAIEHRLFVDVLLSTFEGDSEQACDRAARLAELPAPNSPELRTRVLSLREATVALTRAFSHQARPGDLDRLERASRSSPLVHWAMRYGATIVAIDVGDLTKASALLDGAPEWPEESAFRAFHAELRNVLTARLADTAPVGSA